MLIISRLVNKKLEFNNKSHKPNNHKEVTMTQVNKLRSPFDRLRSYNITPEIALHKAIIMQAIMDACTLAVDRKQKAVKAEAKTWLFGRSIDFYEICNVAELDPNQVIKMASEEITKAEIINKLSHNKKSLGMRWRLKYNRHLSKHELKMVPQ